MLDFAGQRERNGYAEPVLLVEDDDELRELLAQYLTSGVPAYVGANGRDGLALALAHDYIVVLDITGYQRPGCAT